jgi:hypothetical protein
MAIDPGLRAWDRRRAVGLLAKTAIGPRLRAWDRRRAAGLLVNSGSSGRKRALSLAPVLASVEHDDHRDGRSVTLTEVYDSGAGMVTAPGCHTDHGACRSHGR